MPQRTLAATAVLSAQDTITAPASTPPQTWGTVAAPTQTRPRDTATAPAVRPTSAGPVGTVSMEGIGDVIDAGNRSGYAHLGGHRLPTIGRLVSAAQGAAASLRRSALWPPRRGHWQPAPRAVRRRASGRIRVATVALEPNSYVSGPAPRVDRPHTMEVLYLVGGRAHLIASAPDGQVRSASELDANRARVLGAAGNGRGHRFLVNTGDEVAVVVRVTA